MKLGIGGCIEATRPIDGPSNNSAGTLDGVRVGCGRLETGAEDKKMRMFDPKQSLQHQAVPDEILLAYNRDRNVVHLRDCEPSTGVVQANPNTLVISIGAVLYENSPAAAAVCFHPDSPWNTITLTESTEDNAKLEALCIALEIIYSAKLKGPPLEAVYIRCTGKAFCLANTTNLHDLTPADSVAVAKWVQEADKTLLGKLKLVWEDVAGAVDVFLWPALESEIEPVTEMAMAYMYQQHGRNWYKESSKQEGRFQVDMSNNPASNIKRNLIVNAANTVRHTLDGYSIIAPQSITSQGLNTVNKWKAVAKARLHQSLLLSIVASNGCWFLAQELRSKGDNRNPVDPNKFFLAYEMAMEYTASREDMQHSIHNFITQQQAIR